jgi:hypothetical protein
VLVTTLVISNGWLGEAMASTGGLQEGVCGQMHVLASAGVLASSIVVLIFSFSPRCQCTEINCGPVAPFRSLS